VVEDINWKRFLGYRAVVSKVIEGDIVKVVFEMEAQCGLAPHNVPKRLLEPCNAKEKHAPDLRNMVRQTRLLKQAILREGGVLAPKQEALTKVVGNQQCAEDNIDVFGTTVAWSLNLSETRDIKFVPAALTMRLLSDFRNEPVNHIEGLSAPDDITKRVQLLKSWSSRFGTLLLPVYSRSGGLSCQHWTLLVVKSVDGEHVVQYFDSLEPTHAMCRAGATILLQLMCVKTRLPSAENAVRPS
jgi:hypothetical protein